MTPLAARACLVGGVRPVLILVAAAAVLTSACDAETPDAVTMVVDPAETTEGAVRAAVLAVLGERLEAEGATVEDTRLLIWEVRRLAEREAPSDLAIVWARFGRDGTPGWALGQLFRHRAGSDVSWQWYLVTDVAWLELFVFDHAPTNDDVEGFLVHWDFDLEGENGRLVAGAIFADAWTEVIGAPPRVGYPDGTPAP